MSLPQQQQQQQQQQGTTHSTSTTPRHSIDIELTAKNPLHHDPVASTSAAATERSGGPTTQRIQPTDPVSGTSRLSSTQAVYDGDEMLSQRFKSRSRAAVDLPFQSFEQIPGKDRLYRFDHLWEMASGVNPIPVSCFLIHHTDDTYTLVDTGLEETEVKLTESLVRTCGDKLARVLITHGHLDHVGGLPAVLSQFPLVKVFVHRNEYPFILGQLKYGDIPAESCCSLFSCFRSCIQENENFIPSRHINRVVPIDQDSSQLIPDIDILFTPGHTPGHLCFYHRPSFSLFCGDTFMHILSPQLSCCCCCSGLQLSGPPALSTPNFPLAEKSMLKIATHPTTHFTLFCAHDEVVAGVDGDQVLDMLKLKKKTKATAKPSSSLPS